MSRWVSLVELADLAGDDRAEMFCRSPAGGKDVYIPVSVYNATELVEKVGFEIAAILCQHFGGQTISTPNMRGNPQYKGRVIAMLEHGGLSDDDIADKVGCSANYVRKLRPIYAAKKAPSLPIAIPENRRM